MQKAFGIWCEKRDLNPYGESTRPSNVRVYQFRHSRIAVTGSVTLALATDSIIYYLFQNVNTFF